MLSKFTDLKLEYIHIYSRITYNNKIFIRKSIDQNRKKTNRDALLLLSSLKLVEFYKPYLRESDLEKTLKI